MHIHINKTPLNLKIVISINPDYIHIFCRRMKHKSEKHKYNTKIPITLKFKESNDLSINRFEYYYHMRHNKYMQRMFVNKEFLVKIDKIFKYSFYNIIKHRKYDKTKAYHALC